MLIKKAGTRIDIHRLMTSVHKRFVGS